MSSALPNPASGGRTANAVAGGPGIPAPASDHGLMRRAGGTVWAILRHRCPRCHKGRIFRGPLAMNDPCPSCGLLFKREEGTFLGAMYVSYVLSGVLMAVMYFPLSALLPNWDGITLSLLAMLAFLPFTLVIFRYSRTLWIYFKRTGSPGGQSATAYEKARLRDLERRRAETGGGAAGRSGHDTTASAVAKASRRAPLG